MKIAVVDDEQVWTLKVKEYIQAYFKGNNIEIKCYESGEDFLEANEEFVIVFMDIEMQGLDGFSVLAEYRKTQKDTICIILTTHTELSRNGYKVEAFRYIDKYCLEEVNEALDSALLRLERYQMVEIPVISQKQVQVPCYNILYFEAFDHDIMMHTINGAVFKCSESLTQVMERLEKKGFIMTGRSYLVNIDHIRKVEVKQIVLDTGMLIPLSRRKYPEVQKIYFDWKISRANG